MTGGFALALSVLAALGPSGSERCPDDATALAQEAETLLASGTDPAALERARRLYRRVRILCPSPDFLLRAADLACVAGDEEECGDLLSEVAEADGDLVMPADRMLLARRAESRRAWREAISHYVALGKATRDASLKAWAGDRIRRLEVDAEAQSIAAPSAAPPPPEARRALGQARRAVAAGDLASAREKLELARRLSPGYVEAALALAALETREGRVAEAVRAYREALAGDPGRFEALVGLANVLWDEPDRAAKEEALTLTDRAIAARPDATELLKVSATRWADFGDAPKALARLDAYRRRAGAAEKRATESLRETLARRVDSLLAGEPAAEEPEIPELSSPAIDEWKVAQAYFRRGDPDSLAAALDHLREAERLDPTFARAPELAGAIHERRGDLSLAQKAYERAVAADPARAGTYERLALLLARQPGKEQEADEAWASAEQAGSSEALFHLAASALRQGQRGEALALYRRYLAESPGGLHTEEVTKAVEKLETRRRALWAAGGGAAAVLLVAAAVVAWRRRTGRTFEQWIRAQPEGARDARPIVGRLRHEVVKHGGLLLADAARKLSEADPETRRRTATLLRTRLFGAPGTRGLLAESSDAFDRLEALARKDGVRLDLVHRDPLFSPIARASRILRRTQASLARIEQDGTMAGSVEGLERAATLLRSTSGPRMSRLLDEASSTLVRAEDLRSILEDVGAEKASGGSPSFEWSGPDVVAVRIDRADWETIWRNLFANALEAGPEGRLGVFAELARDAVTGTPVARFVLADDVAGALTSDMIRGRAADRGWGVVADLVRRHDGVVEVVPPPAGGYRKGIRIDLPALEPEVPA